MKREIYDEDHEAFRASVRQFLDREVTPHLETYAGNHGLDRDFWLAAGKQGFLGLEIPEVYGGSEAGDYRFNAVLTEELAKVNMTLPSCVGIHADITVPYLVHLTTDEQKARWLPRAATSTMSAEPPLVMKVLEPLITQPSPSRTAVVRRFARSDPPPGSVMPMAVTSSPLAARGSQRAFCSSVVRWTR